ncbi:hypothetical protein [Hyphomicrobium sulfonivorans]|uniref:hypothetical protein n=1 Tax=Hyphomicrobium sulfonivorans TaxID=121290 RepID=UPI00156F09E2|nr:hypothetical protein [Hyphomicrobium sulfonivorans]MBI1650142.1 hypothetical protein [Hyphomicrobium sulfonivorans]NSL73057.1 hypothetical protein [Hyphomicrobium sulfonivorans]
MATIVTVHGTFSSGPVEGQKWWQRGSCFSTRIAELVEGSNGKVQVEPFIWDGLNSEMARNAAGARLAARLHELDEQGEPFAVIGHSHGGSVLSAALLNASRMKQSMQHMQRWITVGTPFIETRRQRFLFSRLSVLGKAVYLTLLMFLVLGIMIAMGGSVDSAPEAWVMLVLVFLTPIAVFYAVLRYRESKRSLRFNRRLLGFADKHFADRWFSLWHAKDEAVQCLKAVKRLDLTIFPRHFAVSSLNLLAVGFVPLLCLLALNSQTVMNAIAARVFSSIDALAAEQLYPSNGTNIFENAAVLFLGLLIIPANLIMPDVQFDGTPLPVQIGLVLFGIAVLIGTVYLLTLVFNAIARAVSHGLSLMLNPVTLSQLKAATYGSDAREDFAIDAREWPIWLSRGFPPLTPDIAAPLEQASDRAIGNAVPKFRNIIDSLTCAETAEATSDVVADYLTWQELIHTSYFDQDSVVKLIAFALCQSDGFKPSAKFAMDPDFTAVQRAYAAIIHGEVKIAGSHAEPQPLITG